MKIIDFRFRPPYDKFLEGWLYDVDYLENLSRRFNSTVPAAAINKWCDLWSYSWQNIIWNG